MSVLAAAATMTGVIASSWTARAALFPLPLQAAQAAEAAEATRVAEAEHSTPAAPTTAAVAKANGSQPVPWSRPPGIIRRVDNVHNWIAITFDACATNGQANGFDSAVFHVLQRERIPATIFTSGRWVEFHPAAMKQLAAEPLIEFANHSYDHPHMTRLSADDIAVELDRTEAALGHYGRQSVAFRPPFGEFNDRVLEVARQRKIPAVLWDVVSGDPSAGATAGGLTRTVVRNTRAGSIVIFHINGRAAQTATALPSILRQLRARGFEFVHLSTLLSSGVVAGASGLSGAAPAGQRDDNAIMPPSELQAPTASAVAATAAATATAEVVGIVAPASTEPPPLPAGTGVTPPPLDGAPPSSGSAQTGAR